MEQQFIEWLKAKVGSDGRLDVGNGDDAAVLRPPAGRRTVFCTDMLAEGVHFPPAPDYDPFAVGQKAVGVNLSDVAAMAGRPEAAVASVTLPRHGGQQIAERLLEGMLAMASRFDVRLVGGDTTAWDGPLVVNVAMLGSVTPGTIWRRDAARPGDLLLVTGGLGGSLRGRHLAVEPRVEEARVLSSAFTVHAAIDISDGLTLDLSRMMEASGCGAELILDEIPIHADAVAAATDDPQHGDPLARALGDGEDFELLMSMPEDQTAQLLQAIAEGSLTGWPGTPLAVVGRVLAEPGLVAVAADGSRRPLAAKGYLHEFS